MNDRDEFAKAAMAGLMSNAVYNDRTVMQIATEAYELADAMLGERASTTHDGSPEPTAHLPTTDHAGGRSRESDAGTGDTPKPIMGYQAYALNRAADCLERAAKRA